MNKVKIGVSIKRGVERSNLVLRSGRGGGGGKFACSRFTYRAEDDDDDGPGPPHRRAPETARLVSNLVLCENDVNIREYRHQAWLAHFSESLQLCEVIRVINAILCRPETLGPLWQGTSRS